MRCKLAVNDHIIDLASKYHAIETKKVMTFKYLGVEVSGNQVSVDEVRDQNQED